MPLPLFLIPIVTGLVAQALKHLFTGQGQTRLTGEGYLPRYGGMPSAHTAFSFSLATVVAMTDGLASVTFAMAAAMVIFVLDDALRMRIFLGHHGQALSRLISKLPPEDRAQYPQLETHLGHKPAEVIVGALLGVGLTLVILVLLRLS